MILVVAALAGATDNRAVGDAAEAAGDHVGALAAWRACAEHGPDRDARYCATRAAALAPQEADGFAGWAILAEVRRDYRTLGSDAAVARIEAALTTMPESPAAPAMRVWLANERARRGETEALARAVAEVEADPATTPTERAFVATRLVNERTAAKQRIAGLAGAAIAVGYGLVALRGPGTLRWGSAGLALLVMGGIPTLFSALYEADTAPGFLRTGAAIALGVLLAGRAPRWISVPGTLGAFAAVAWDNGWYPGLGWR